jgi:prevent-host-death family protein
LAASHAGTLCSRLRGNLLNASCLVQVWTKLIRLLAATLPMAASPGRIVNVHEAKTHFSRLIDAAHAGETIVVAKGGKPWARLVPLEPPLPRRVPGVLAGRLTLPPLDVLLEALPEEELAALEQPLL